MVQTHKLKDTTILIGDVFNALKKVKDKSIHVGITSPPYWMQRTYGVPGEIGREGSSSEYVETIVKVLQAVRLKLRDDATFWLNIGDCRAKPNICASKTPRGNLLLIPDRLAIALQDDGWIVAQKIIWKKINSMPDSAMRRPADSYEFIFLLYKTIDAYCDMWAIHEPSAESTRARLKRAISSKTKWKDGAPGQTKQTITSEQSNDPTRLVAHTRNSRNVWDIATERYSKSHYAVFPREIPYRAIKAGTSEFGCCNICGAPYKRILEKVGSTQYGGKRKRADAPGAEVSETSAFSTGAVSVRQTKEWISLCSCKHNDILSKPIVLDPFVGSGTTLAVAHSLGCESIGIDLDARNLPLIKERIKLGYTPKVPLGEENYG